MHPDIVLYVFPQQLHPVEGELERVEGAAAALREHGRMGTLAVEGHVQLDLSQGVLVYRSLDGGVGHEGQVNIPEAAVVPHVQLGGGGLLRRSSIDHQPVGQVGHRGPEGLGAQDEGGALHMVAAAVAQPLQRIVFA